MVAPNPNKSTLNQQLNQKTAASAIRLDPDDLFDSYEFALKRCGSISGQSIASVHGSHWRDSPAAQRHRLKYLERKHSAALSVAGQPPHLPPPPAYDNLHDISLQDPAAEANRGLGEQSALSRCNSCFHGYRFVVTMMGGTSVGLMLLLRFNITIAVLQMVNQTHLYLEENPNANLDDYLAEGYAETGGEFNWNNEIVAIILAWYMFGYTLPGPLMAKVASLLGCRLAVPLLLATCALATLLTPLACHLGWQYVVVCRLLNGLGASAVVPQLLSLLEKWVRYDEITAGLSVAYLLNATLSAITPLLCSALTELHWSYAFYVPALITLVFCALWLLLITDEPHSNWLVSERELDYISECDKLDSQHPTTADITSATTTTCAPSDNTCTGEKAQQQVATVQRDTESEDGEFSYKADSWLDIFRVPSFYAYIALWCGYCSSYSGFVFVLPTYMQQFLKIHVSENGFYCFIIQLGCIVSVLWPHQMLKLFQRGLFFFRGLSRARARIACYALCCSVGAFTWIYVGIEHKSQLVMLFLNRAAHPGNDVLVTSCLMANYAKAGLSGHAFAVVNSLGNFSIVISSTFIGWLLDYTGASRAGWCAIFVALGVTQLLMFVIFATCVSSDPIKFKVRARGCKSKADHLERGDGAGTGAEKAERPAAC